MITGLTVTSSLDGNEKTYDGGSLTLSAEATVTPDTATVSYQWYKDGEEISGATESTYTAADSVSDSGTYKCVVIAVRSDRDG